MGSEWILREQGVKGKGEVRGNGCLGDRRMVIRGGEVGELVGVGRKKSRGRAGRVVGKMGKV